MAGATVAVDDQLAGGRLFRLAMVDMLMMTEVRGGTLRGRDFVLAICSGHTPGELERQKQSKHKDQQAAHGGSLPFELPLAASGAQTA